MCRSWRKVIQTAIFSSLVYFYASSANAVDFPYLSQGINRINDIFHKSSALSQEDFLEVATLACNTLTQLMKDPEFDRIIERLHSAKLNATPEDVRQIFRDLNQLSAFLEIEYMQARANGYSALTSFDIINSISNTSIESISPTDPTSISKNIYELQYRSCNIAYSKKVNAEQAEAIRRGVIGVGVAVVNVGLIYVAFLAPFVVPSSVAVAMTLVTEAIIKLA
jgi:hypothetical protein